MTIEEKAYSAIMALKMIAKSKVCTHYVEECYGHGHDVPCAGCERMQTLAKTALEELEED